MSAWASAADPCPPRDTSVPSPYPITGYWLFPSTDPCLTRAKVEAIHRLGGDTLITFGPRLQPRDVDGSGRVLNRDGSAPDRHYADCIDDGLTCYQAARQAIDGAAIRQTFVYNSSDHFGPDLWRCQTLDRRIDHNGRR